MRGGFDKSVGYLLNLVLEQLIYSVIGASSHKIFKLATIKLVNEKLSL